MLKIHLDKLRRLSEQLSRGLEQWHDGTLTRDGFLELLDRQRDAHLAWEAKQRRYFAASDGEVNH